MRVANVAFALMMALLLVSFGASAQVPKDRMPEFVATGAVVAFDEICLKIYSDYDRSNQWMTEHSGQENISESGDAYKEAKTDRVFLVGTGLANYVVTFGRDNGCTVHSSPADKSTAQRLLEQLMSGYASTWNTKFQQTQNEVLRGREQVETFTANIPGTDKPILVISVSYISMESEPHPLVKISGVSLMRLQTSNKPLPPTVPKAGAAVER